MHTSQSHPIMGTPTDVPVPRKVKVRVAMRSWLVNIAYIVDDHPLTPESLSRLKPFERSDILEADQ